jgi:hypothetical protein
MRVVWTRAIVAGFWLTTAAYCLLSAISFASEQFLKPGLVLALATFAAWHRWISLAALIAAGAALAPWLRSGHRGARAFIAGWGLVGATLFIAPPLSQLEPSPIVLVVALLGLVPPVWIALMDLSRERPATAWPHDETADDVLRDFAACVLSALVVTATHAVAALPSVLPFGIWSAGLESMRSLSLHLVVFAGIFAATCVIRGASRLISRRHAVEAWLARCALACALALFMFSIVLRPLSLVGVPGAIAAAAFGLALAATLGPRATGAGPGLVQALSGLVPAWATRSGLAATGWLLAVALAIWAVERQAAVSDWNFTIAKSAALASWLLALAAALRVLPGRVGGPPAVPFVVCFAFLGVYQAAFHVTADAAAAAGAWKGSDPSVRLIADALAPAAPVLDEGLQDFLQRHTNIPRSTRVEPVGIDLAALDGAPSPTRPHIFLFVVDSLRRDYLSPYNDAVSFTPALGRFARESTVFERAFTRYGATGLSVPALWVGGLVLHKQYVTPFGPMNSLAKLLEHEQYDQWIGMDNILDVILPPSPLRIALDANTGVADYRFCRTLGEIRGRLGSLTAAGRPTFVYSLPQDIHVSVITREGAAPVDSGSYGAFYPPYASRIRRFDACFGEFIDDLKARGLFERSIVIVTSDHGDSLGEQGRMGHAYTIFPEILQVPLIVHLPSDLSAGLHADMSVPAFNTDITPTLYALLGHAPQRPAPFFGRPLFRREEAPAPLPPAEFEVVASSYGSVYGALLDNARRLYVIDGIALREYAYVLDGTGAGRAVAVTNEDRVRSQRAIRATVEGLAAFYGYRP